MKKLSLSLALSVLTIMSFAQPVTNNPVNGGVGNASFWSRQGNNSTLGANNVFGTQAGFNSGIYTITNGITSTANTDRPRKTTQNRQKRTAGNRSGRRTNTRTRKSNTRKRANKRRN